MPQPIPQNFVPQETAATPSCRDGQARRARQRKRAQKRRQRIVGLFAVPFLLAGATGGAYWGGHLLRQAAVAEPSLAQTATPLASSLDQVAENGAASSRKKRSADSTSLRDNDGSAATLQTVYELVKEHYVDELPSDRILTRGAVRSLLQSLNDPNSQFLEPNQRQILENESRGKYGGIGANLAVRAQKQNGYTEYKLVVVSPLPGSPAERAGLRAGDVITHLGGKWVLGYDPFLKASKLAQKAQADDGASDAIVRQTFEAARAKTQGGVGLFAAQMVLKGDETVLQAAKLPTNRVLLTVERTGETAPLSLSVSFKEMEVASVASKPLPGGIGYVKINTLSDAAPGAFEHALQNTAHGSGLVLDLRNNAGGLIEAAQAIDAALPLPAASGKSTVPFGYEKVGHSGQLMPLTASADKVPAMAAGAAPKLVVLVNAGTASSAESLAASLADRHRALLVGDTKRTFGDASVQTLYPLSDGSAFTLTTGEWLSGRKQSWAGRGLTPHYSPPVSIASSSPPSDPALTQAVALLQTSPNLAPPVRHAARPIGKTRGRGL